MLFMMILVSPLTPKVESRAVYVIPTTTIATTAQPIYITVQDDTILYAGVALMTILAILLAYKWLNKSVHRAKLALEISDENNCVMIPLLQLPHCPKFYHCQSDSNFSDFKVTGWIYPIFHWKRGSLVVTHLLDRSRPELPDTVPIPLLTALRLRRMLKSTVYVYLIAEHATYAFQMHICPLTCRACVASLNAVEAPAVVDEIAT